MSLGLVCNCLNCTGLTASRISTKHESKGIRNTFLVVPITPLLENITLPLTISRSSKNTLSKVLLVWNNEEVSWQIALKLSTGLISNLIKVIEIVSLLVSQSFLHALQTVLNKVLGVMNVMRIAQDLELNVTQRIVLCVVFLNC